MSNPKVKDDDYYQSKSASLFKSCACLRFSGLQDYETFLEKFFSILSISGFLQTNGELLLSEYAAADNAIYDCIVCASSGDALTYITAVKSQIKRSGSNMLPRPRSHSLVCSLLTEAARGNK